jgi:hypothetical protein
VKQTDFVTFAEIEKVVPWSGLCALIEPFHPKPSNGRPPFRRCPAESIPAAAKSSGVGRASAASFAPEVGDDFRRLGR